MIPRIIAMFLGGIGAVGASQAPEFMQQYAQRLGGALDELAAIVRSFDQDAAREGLDRRAGLQRMESSPDTFVARRGRSYGETIRRYERLEAQRAALESPNGFSRMAALVGDLDRDIARRAMENYRPAVPVTAEGIAFALLGFLAGVFGGGLAASLVALPFRRRAARRAAIRSSP